MHTFKKIGEGLLLAGLVFLCLLLVFETNIQIPTWLKIGGRMHPMFLHFPIVLLLLSFLSLWIPSHEQSVWKWFDGLRLLAAISAIVTAVMGMLLSLEENEKTSVLQLHKWGGVAIAFLGVIFYAFSNSFIRHKRSGKVFTILAGLLIFFTGHWGAGLTHGDNYLLEPMAANKKVNPQEAVVFNDIIKPILERKCITCHREGNMKGGLLLENAAGLLKGGKTGPLLVPGDPNMSLLIYRIHLPINEKKHMPPASKPALTEWETSLLYAWIKSGAIMKEKLFSLPAQDSFRQLATRSLGTDEMPANVPVYDFPAADNKLIATLNNNYRVIQPLGAGAAALAVHFYGISNFSSKALQELLPLKQQVTELSLARMPVKDEDLKTVSQFINVNRLNLNYTDISGNGLQHLKALKKLQQLSLSGTKVNAAALQQVDSLPELSDIFVWDTPIDSIQSKALRLRNKKWKIETGYKNNKDLKIALSPPALRVPAGVLDKATTIELKHPIRGVEIRYTLDGSIPDSIKSAVYTKAFYIDSTITLKARAFKEGWYGSSEVQATYIMRKVIPDSMQLITKADVKYALLNKDQLADGDLGDLNFNNGQWVGFQKNDAELYLYFNKDVTISNVLLNLLKNTRAHIFPPVKIEIWGGSSKAEMRLLTTKKPFIPKKNEPATSIQEQLEFSPATLRVVKIKLHRLTALPPWHDNKGKPAWVMVSEIVMN